MTLALNAKTCDRWICLVIWQWPRFLARLLVMVICVEVNSATDCQFSENIKKGGHLLESGTSEREIRVSDFSSRSDDQHPNIFCQ
jgi:hypothetical protein